MPTPAAQQKLLTGSDAALAMDQDSQPLGIQSSTPDRESAEWCRPFPEYCHLAQLLERAALRWPDQPAVEDEQGRTLSFAELDQSADLVDAQLAMDGVARGDRIGVLLPKSIEAVVAIHGILRAGASYVPIDPVAPLARSAAILASAQVKEIVIHESLINGIKDHWPAFEPFPKLIVVGGESIPSESQVSWEALMAGELPRPDPSPRSSDDLCYILYTSGSTGEPKGVMLSHENALCFLDWAQETFGLSPGQRFASHAPFHFDLSVFDLFASCRVGGTLVLIGESLGKEPGRLGDFLAERSIDVWYSAPSILRLLTQFGRLDRPGFLEPSLVLFAGEVFPVKHLKALRHAWPEAEFWNLYGPTETNVCTAHRIPQRIPEDRVEPYPIGEPCPPLLAKIVNELGVEVLPGEVGELLIAGPRVMQGYFGRPDLARSAFVTDEQGQRWYRTGDLVVEEEQGSLVYRGRRDRMVKRRGYRIELNEIEAALNQHEGVDRIAVVAVTSDEGVSIHAFVVVKPRQKASVIAMKRHCAATLPSSMIPDFIQFLPELPETSTAKVDYPKLEAIAASPVSRGMVG